MGMRFHKAVAFGKVLRLNLSKSGISLGLGSPGLNVNLGSRGLRQTIGLPGTGISYQSFARWRDRSALAARDTPPRPVHMWILLVAAAVLFVVTAMTLFGQAGNQAPATAPTTSGSVTVPKKTEPAPQQPQVVPRTSPTRTFTAEEIVLVQDMLRRGGLKPGAIDGVLGPRTRDAIRRFEQASGWTVTGEVSERMVALASVDGSRRAAGQDLAQ